jgi:hypothetical protein
MVRQYKPELSRLVDFTRDVGEMDPSRLYDKIEEFIDRLNSTIKISEKSGINYAARKTPDYVSKAINGYVVQLEDAPVIVSDARLVDYDENGFRKIFRVKINGNRTLTCHDMVDGQPITWCISKEVDGQTLSLDADVFRLGATIPSVTLTTSASKQDYLTGLYCEPSKKIDIVEFVKGF